MTMDGHIGEVMYWPNRRGWYTTVNSPKEKMTAILSGAKPVLDDVEECTVYARKVIGGRWPDAEPIIAESPEFSWRYAHDVVCGKWEMGEPAILTGASWAYLYTRYVIGERWEAAEKVIVEDASWSYRYAIHVIEGRWKQAEPIIASDPHWRKEYQDYFGVDIRHKIV